MRGGLIQFDDTDKEMVAAITKAIQNHQEKTLGLQRSDFPRLCPPLDALKTIWNQSLEAEMKLYPQSDVSKMRNDFEVAAVSKLCVVDVEKTLEEVTWQSFFKSLNVEYTIL